MSAGFVKEGGEVCIARLRGAKHGDVFLPPSKFSLTNLNHRASNFQVEFGRQKPSNAVWKFKLGAAIGSWCCRVYRKLPALQVVELPAMLQALVGGEEVVQVAQKPVI